MSTQHKNGNGLAGAKLPTENKTTSVVTPNPRTEKPEEQKPQAVVKSLDGLPPLEDRLHKLNVLFTIQSKYNRLKASLAKLEEFDLKSDKESCEIEFTDSKHNEWSTNNPAVMPEFLAFLKETIKKKIKELEPQLVW